MTKLEALQTAQRRLLRGEVKAGQNLKADRLLVLDSAKPSGAIEKVPEFQRDEKTLYAHPYYGAPFFLMGNWL
jgi:CHAT domain-containing protein